MPPKRKGAVLMYRRLTKIGKDENLCAYLMDRIAAAVESGDALTIERGSDNPEDIVIRASDCNGGWWEYIVTADQIDPGDFTHGGHCGGPGAAYHGGTTVEEFRDHFVIESEGGLDV